MNDKSKIIDYPPLRWSMIEAFLDWDVARVNYLLSIGEPRNSPEWRITDRQVEKFYVLMMDARNGDDQVEYPAPDRVHFQAIK